MVMVEYLKILKQVKKFPCLWNPYCEMGKKPMRKSAAWCEIAKKIGKEEKYCRSQWRSISSTFFQSSMDSNQHEGRQPALSKQQKKLLQPIVTQMKSCIKLAKRKQRSSAVAEFERSYDALFQNTNTANDKVATAAAAECCNKTPDAEVDAAEWMLFLRSTLSDVLALSKAQQRKFKLEFLRVIAECHAEVQ